MSHVSQTAVDVRGVGKTFRVPHQRHSSVKERLTQPFATTEYDVVPALRDVTFEVPKGEFFGIVGRNGGGKSTLLRCIAHIYAADTGTIEVSGSLAPFIELGAGFNQNLSARENAIVSAVLLGMSRTEARDRVDEIIAFAELEDFADTKLKNLSSGMAVRLGFSVTAQVDADVLLFDEVLAVGDAAFRQKCFDRFRRMKDAGRTVLLVTHSMEQVERFCDRALLLERGEVLAIGEPGNIARAYNRVNLEHTVHGRGAPSGRDDAGVQIDRAWFERLSGEVVDAVAQGEACCTCIEATMNRSLEDPVFEIELRDERRRIIFATTSRRENGSAGGYLAGERALVRMRFDNWLAPGRYAVSASISRGAGAKLCQRDDLATLNVYGTADSGGVVDLPHEFEVRKA